MWIFALRPAHQPPPAKSETAAQPEQLKPETAQPQMVGLGFGWPPPPERLDAEVQPGFLASQYEARIDEIFQIINKKKQDPGGKIKVEKVKVKLGVDTGGKIGWFVEGRLDVSFAFEVEFKVSE